VKDDPVKVKEGRVKKLSTSSRDTVHLKGKEYLKSRMNFSSESFPNCMMTTSGWDSRISWKFFTEA
jgi:hypothetical protein